jgi:cyclic-di-AMP phosphodiesterase PgpH
VNSTLNSFRANGRLGSVGIAAVFFVATTAILMLRQEVIEYRPGQFVQHNITSRVDFDFADADQLARLREQARQLEPRVYRPTSADYWAAFQNELMALPDRATTDPGSLPAFSAYAGTLRPQFNQAVQLFVDNLRQRLTNSAAPLVVLPADQRQQELNGSTDVNSSRAITLSPSTRVNVAGGTYAAAADLPPEVLSQLRGLADPIPRELRPAVVQMAYAFLQHHPTHELDLAATTTAQDRAFADVLPSDAVAHYTHDTVIVPGGVISDRDWQVLQAENAAYIATEQGAWTKQLAGTALTVLCLTAVLAAYVTRYQSRIIRNHIRAVVLAALITSMLLISALAGTGSGPLYFYGFGIAPTILTAIILTIAYDQRFAIGVASVEAVLVTSALNEGISFFLILLIGVLVSCFLLDDVRTRSKLVEVGGAAAIAMMVVTAAGGLNSLEAVPFVIQNTLYAGAAGLAAGFIALGILPFVERVFHITTSMTLLELGDASQPLLKRLAFEAPGTYNHSLQVATLSEAAAEAIGANALACRVGAYYHDVGKLIKADYFAENQPPDGTSRHINLSPNVSLLIILSHVKDGLELARQHHLPATILQFIQQHHGTTLVEFFYKEACRLMNPMGAQVPETEFRYPGPKPKCRETAILMLADCVESACRAMPQPNAERMETLVHELVLRRLRDGQFDECDLTLRDLDRVEHSLAKTLLGVYHGRLAYPSMAAYEPPSTPQPPTPSPARKLA